MIHPSQGSGILHQTQDISRLAAGNSLDQQVHLQNMQDIDRLMNSTFVNNSQHTFTDTSSVTNSNSPIVASPTNPISIRPVHIPANSHVSTSSLPPHDIRRVLSSNQTRNEDTSNAISTPTDISTRVYETSDGCRYLRLNAHVVYSVSNARTRRPKEDSLVDRGANGGFAGDDVRVLDHTFKTANVTGIEEHTVSGLPIGTVAGLVETHKGKAVVIMLSLIHI